MKYVVYGMPEEHNVDAYKEKNAPIVDFSRYLDIACEYEHLHMVKYISTSCQLVTTRGKAFIVACRNLKKDIASWLYDNYDIEKVYLNEAIVYTSRLGDRFFIEWLLEIGADINSTELEGIMYAACSNNHLELAKWLYGKGAKIVLYLLDDIFIDVCCDGYLEMAKWLHSMGANILFINENGIDAIIAATGHLDIVKWLYSLGAYVVDSQCPKILEYMDDVELEYHEKIETIKWYVQEVNIPIKELHGKNYIYDTVYNEAPEGTDMCEWLYDLSVDINDEYGYNTYKTPFLTSILSGQHDISDWIVKTYKNIEYDKAFVEVCRIGHLKAAQRIYQYGQLRNEYLINAFKNVGSVDVAQWLITLIDLDDIDIEETFVNASERGNLEVVQWLHSQYPMNDRLVKICYMSTGATISLYNHSRYQKLRRWLRTLNPNIKAMYGEDGLTFNPHRNFANSLPSFLKVESNDSELAK